MKIIIIIIFIIIVLIDTYVIYINLNIFENLNDNKKEIFIGVEPYGEYGKQVLNNLLLYTYPNSKLTWIMSPKDKNASKINMIIRSDTGGNGSIYNKKVPYIVFSGESHMNNVPIDNSKSILFLGPIKTNKNFLWMPFCLSSPYIYKKRIDTTINRSFLLAYCSSNCINYRENFFKMFVEKSNSNLCHSLGSCSGGLKKIHKKIEGVWSDNTIIEYYKKYKFVIAFENSIGDYYITEKILNAFYSGAIPIYSGSSKIKELFNEKAFICLQDFENDEKCIEYILNLTDKQRADMMSEPIYNKNSDLIHIFNKEYNTEKHNKVLQAYINTFKNVIDN
jgi:hypothetical protein